MVIMAKHFLSIGVFVVVLGLIEADRSVLKVQQMPKDELRLLYGQG